ncbi:hypothetical protein DCS_00209 [Drechmeria coniospora]|uniref:Vacuolar protein-sorting-associated protein 36 n=1 Tax=Drechmeria coniospora TaxID=98403 RepID=A0A151GQ11_DRECN|nr:hypothetical protein DCS_00209 [Drechmeria coniospora]KYK59082.1 hypothetical protein DCS_00209 [Drechmeria coniospora]
MFLKHVDLTSALRPSYLPDEVLLFVQDNVGLYEGKFKLPSQQNGQVYLTSHRICYVDKNEPRANSVALDLKEVDRYEFYAGFLKSSPKVTIIPKPSKRSFIRDRAIPNSTSSSALDPHSSSLRDGPFRPPAGPPPATTATWVCTICSFSNPVPVNFDPQAANAHTPLPPCLACGIKPTLSHVLKAAITNASNRTSTATGVSNGPGLPVRGKGPDLAAQATSSGDVSNSQNPRKGSTSVAGHAATVQCPRCTFSNHPSLLSCEICGASLKVLPSPSMTTHAGDEFLRAQSPGPVLDGKSKAGPNGIHVSESVKFSFRDGGERIFYERLKGAITQRKWLLQNAPPAPKSGRMYDGGNGASSDTAGGKTKTAGIAGLEQLGLNMRKNDELLIGSAFEDLAALMSSAKEVIALAERFARQNAANGDASAEEKAILAESASQLGLITTKDIVGGGASESLYLSELSRNMAEFLADDSRGVLKKAGGIITLVDLWAMFNRARGGVELVSPMDFKKAAGLWESLKLPVRLRTFRSGVMVVQGRDRTDDITIRTLLGWLQDLHEFPPERDVAWDWREFGRGVTAQEAAERFGWSLGVAEEELLMAEDNGALCREEGLEGLKFWKNYIDTGDIPPPKSKEEQQEEEIIRSLKGSGFV